MPKPLHAPPPMDAEEERQTRACLLTKALFLADEPAFSHDRARGRRPVRVEEATTCSPTPPAWLVRPSRTGVSLVRERYHAA